MGLVRYKQSWLFDKVFVLRNDYVKKTDWLFVDTKKKPTQVNTKTSKIKSWLG